MGGAIGIRLNGDISGLRFGLDGGGAFVRSGLGWLLQPAVRQANNGTNNTAAIVLPCNRFLLLVIIEDPTGTETYPQCRYFQAER